MGLFRRKTADSRRPTSGSPVGAVSVRRSRESVTATAPAPPAPVKKAGTVTEFEATAAQRINSAEDVDPNVKRYGVDGVFKGGGGGFGGAGTK